ncbi:S8 family peptidase [Streptomyces beijiangensis]|uniref:S8 family serine peptidase n=1 Tax=Streptomyces beijiangensis TaxID=163361 RepID=A0A939F496_9ACTN|nr:S8 family serine peptidase [Streptomyces beijiangensis]MBO0511807.1 S8 family serine peptidase [Streptomyces beijiangensis]
MRPLARAALAAVAVCTALPPGIATAAGPPDSATTAATATATTSQEIPAGLTGGRTVTLVTGDKVTVYPGPDGRQLTSVEPAEGRESLPFATVRGKDGHTSVTPADAQPLIAEQRVDPRLFDVTGLLSMKYGDKDRTTLPLIADGAPKSSPAAARSLPAVGFTTGAVKKADLDTVWSQTLKGEGHLWLDGRRRTLDETSTKQIGADKAWAKGLTGKGVTVAVVDTGADTTHPDLAGAIVASKDFTGTDEKDGNGHGTHVASTIAGRGTKHPSVAPGVSLAIAKVLNSQGQGTDSTVLAGMAWAAKDAKAKIINMSLGGTDTQGTDPLEAAVDELSQSTGALFVIAAGNDGRKGDRTVGSPGSADSALTVGAVDSTGALADFSSRGPRIGDYGVKPEIAAPGVGIIAARAAGTNLDTPVDDLYEAASGTSMATPHVAGAAAILAQEHPTWSGARLKDVLTGSASADSYTPFQTGAGQLDVAAAVESTITADPANTSTYVKYGTKSATKTVTYTNTSARTVTLRLSEDAPAIRTDDRSVRVPAHGSASVRLEIGGRGTKPGAYSGTLTARGGGQTVRTVLGAYIEPEAGDVTVNFLDFAGSPVPDQAWSIINMKTGEADAVIAPEGTGTVHLPAGKYTMPVYLRIKDLTGKSVAVMANVPVTVKAGTQTVTVDARTTSKLDAVLDDDPNAKLTQQTLDLNRRIGDIEVDWQTSVSPTTVTMVPPAKAPGLVFHHHSTLIPGSKSVTQNWRADTLDVRKGEVPADLAHHASLATLTHTKSAYRGTALVSQGIALQMGPVYPGSGSVRLIRSTIASGANFTHYVENAEPGLQWDRIIGMNSYTGGVYGTIDIRPLTDGYQEAFGNSAFGPVIASGEAVRQGDTATVTVPNMMADPTPGRRGVSSGSSALTLSQQDGTPIASFEGVDAVPALTAQLPSAKGTYTLTLDQTRDGWPLPKSGHVTTDWTFLSRHTHGKMAQDLPLNSLRIRPEGLDNGNGNGVPSGSPTTQVTVSAVGGPAVRTLKAEVSFDDGTTWTTLPVSRNADGTWTTTVTNIKDEAALHTAATLRITAQNKEGGSVTQTVHSAYEIR